MDPRQPPSDGEPPLLEYLGSGTQSHVFGAEAWVVVVPRTTLLSMLACLVTSRDGVRNTLTHLGGIVAPFFVLDRCRFRGKLPGRKEVRPFALRSAVVRRRADRGCFLDARLARATPERALDHLERMVSLLERLRARGYVMLDFIARNFVYVGESLRICDPGLVIQVRELSWHPSRFTALGFGIGLTRDYLRLLAQLERRTDDSALRERIRCFAETLPARLRALRDQRREVDRDEWHAVDFPGELEKDIRALIGIQA